MALSPREPGVWSRPPGCPEPSAPRVVGNDDAEIPGALVVRAPHLDVPSHGIGDQPLRAIFCLGNLTDRPLHVSAGPLEIETRDPAVAEPERVQPLAFGWAIVDDQRLRAGGGHVELVVPAARWTAIELSADAMPPHFYYRTSYVHRVVFTVAGAGVKGRGYSMYFRTPHLR
jgi:hypothetical protein